MEAADVLSTVGRDVDLSDMREVGMFSEAGVKVGYLTDVSCRKVCMSNGEDFTNTAETLIIGITVHLKTETLKELAHVLPPLPEDLLIRERASSP